MQRRLLSFSRDVQQVLVPDSDHYIRFDRPSVMTDAILGELQGQAQAC